MASKKLLIKHDFAVDPDKRIILENVTRTDIFSIQMVWEGLTGTLDAVIKVQGSNFNPGANIFDDLGLEKILDSASDSHTLIDEKFPFEHGGIDIKKNGVTGGKVTLALFAK